MNLTVITPPAEEPVSLAAAKDFLRLGHAGEDGLVAALISSARVRVEQASGLALISRTLRRVWRRWPAEISGLGVTLAPGASGELRSVRIVDGAEVYTDHTGRFQIDCGRLCLRAWSMVPAVPEGGRVEVEFVAGFGDAADVPEDLILAVKRLVADAYNKRAEIGHNTDERLPDDVQAILDARRGVRL